MNPRELAESIAAGRFQPAYYFFGTEDYRITEAERHVARSFLPDRQLTTNYRRLDGRRTPAADLVAELAALPMLGERRVIAVSDIQSYKPTELERILKMLQPPDPNRIVIFTTPAARAPKKNTRFFKTMAGAVTVVEFHRLTPQETRALIRAKFRKEEVTIDEEGVTLLVELTAGSRGALEQEVHKLVDYAGPGGEVTADVVRRMAAGSESYAVFDLADKILAGDRARALKQLERLLAQGQSATGILYFLGQHYLSLYLVQQRRPLPPMQRWKERRYRAQVGILSDTQLEQAIPALADADAAIRRQELPPRLALERVVVRLLADRMGEPGGISGRN